MTERTFDTNTLMTAAREAFAPMFKAQHEGFKTIEKLARWQYAFAGDVLESGLARVNATFSAGSPSEWLNKHTELSREFSEKLRARAEEFTSLNSEIQAKLGQFGNEVIAKAVPARKAA